MLAFAAFGGGAEAPAGVSTQLVAEATGVSSPPVLGLLAQPGPAAKEAWTMLAEYHGTPVCRPSTSS